MKRNGTLTNSSLLTIVLSSVHIAQDVIHAPEAMDLNGTVIILLIILVMLYGTVQLAGRRVGYVIMLLGGIGAAYMPFLHTMGPRAARWGLLFVWVLLGLGVTGAFTAILSAQELWRSFRTPVGSSPLEG